MRVRRAGQEAEKIELQMTPMIDIVFQLLVFFIMTFKIVTMEGDFNIRMPASGAPETPLDRVEPLVLRVRMAADANGNLAKLSLDNKILASSDPLVSPFDLLHAHVLEQVGPQGAPPEGSMHEVEFDCDYNLRYEYVIEGITAVSGHVTGSSANRETVKLIEKIKFAPARKSG